jgi:hypothetical protein
MSGPGKQEALDEARSLLESIALLETVAAAREGKVEALLELLSARGMSGADLARELDVSEESVATLLRRDEPKPPHERAGISEETIQRLEPVQPAQA